MTGAAVVLGLAALASVEPASAQFYGGAPGGLLPPGAVRRIMQDHGFQVLAPPLRRGDVYIVDAVDDSGRRLRLIVDAYEGVVVRRFVIWGRMAPGGRPAIAEGDRLEFPGEGRRPRLAPPPREREDTGGLFGFFTHPNPPADVPGPSADRDREPGEPRVVPGIGPDAPPRPRRVARPKPVTTPPRPVARANPTPLPGPAAVPAGTDGPPPVDDGRPKGARVVPEPAPVVREAAPPVAPKPREANVPVAPKPPPAAPKANDTVAAPRPAPVPKPAAEKPIKQTAEKPVAKPASKAAEPKKKSGPLNDIPPAPLE